MKIARLILGLSLALVLAGCSSGPHLGAGLHIGAGGLSVHPAVYGRVAGVGVAVSP